MDKVGTLCFFVGVLGVISAGAGFAAEVTRVKVSEITVSFGECIYPSSPATALGIVAAAALLIVKIIINAATGCFCCVKRTGHSNLSQALCFYIISWITFFIAMGLLLTGARFNSGNSQSTIRDGYYYCYYIKPGVFASGGLLAALSSIFGIFYYRTLNSKQNGASNVPNQGGIAMAPPQFPPPQFPPENPGFMQANGFNKQQPQFPSVNPGNVYADAYNRQPQLA